MDDVEVATSDPEFGRLVHEERVAAPLMYVFGLSALLMVGLGIVAFLIIDSAPRKKPLGTGDWLGVAAVEGVMLAFGLLFAYLMWREYRTRFGVRWRVFERGIEWRRGGAVRRLSLEDVKQIGVTNRMVVT